MSPYSEDTVWLSAHVDEMTRSELQRALRNAGLPSGGTNVALRQRYKSRILFLELYNEEDGGKLLQVKKKSSNAATARGQKPTITKKASAKAVDDDEKRLKRFRSSCPKIIEERLGRAKTQKMFLIRKGEISRDDGDAYPSSCEFIVLGSTGNVYNVTIQRLPQCTCPDYTKHNQLCKHILFVLLKVMGVPEESPLVYQAAWIGSELRELFDCVSRRVRLVSGGCNFMANEDVQDAFARLEIGRGSDNAPRRTVGKGDDCPICFDPLGGNCSITHCRSQCGAIFHAACVRNWLQLNESCPTCPMCRHGWQDEGRGYNEGYANFGRLQGQPTVRDTSTYRQWGWEYSKRW